MGYGISTVTHFFILSINESARRTCTDGVSSCLLFPDRGNGMEKSVLCLGQGVCDGKSVGMMLPQKDRHGVSDLPCSIHGRIGAVKNK